MKASQRDFASRARAAGARLRIVLVCGPDEAGAAAALTRLMAALPDPGERCELTGAELRADPVRLVDEARSTSLFGSARHVLVRASGDEAHDALALFCEMVDRGEADRAWPIFVHATAATDKARSARLLAEREDALVGLFHPPEPAELAREVARLAGAAGLRIEGDLPLRIARAAGLDLRLAAAEVEKLALYCDASPLSPVAVTAEALAAIGATTEDDGILPLVDAALCGETGRLASELARMRSQGLNPVAVALAAQRRAVQLAGLRARLRGGGDLEALFERERVPRRERAVLKVEIRLWPARKLERLVERLAALHRALLRDSAAADLRLGQELVDIARVAAAGKG